MMIRPSNVYRRNSTRIFFLQTKMYFFLQFYLFPSIIKEHNLHVENLNLKFIKEFHIYKLYYPIHT